MKVFKFSVPLNRKLLILGSFKILFLTFLLAVAEGALSTANGQEAAAVQKIFRVDSVVKLTENEVVTEIKTSTVFGEDAVFDFIGDNGEIIVYQWQPKDLH